MHCVSLLKLSGSSDSWLAPKLLMSQFLWIPMLILRQGSYSVEGLQRVGRGAHDRITIDEGVLMRVGAPEGGGAHGS